MLLDVCRLLILIYYNIKIYTYMIICIYIYICIYVVFILSYKINVAAKS